MGIRQAGDRRSRSGGNGAGVGPGPVRRPVPGVRRGQRRHRTRARRDHRRTQRVARRDRRGPHRRGDGRHDRRLRHRRRHEDRPGSAVTLFDVLSRQRRFVYLLVGLLSVAGVWAAFRLPSAIYPELVFSRITVIAQGSTLGARQVVFSITRPLEEAVSVVPGVTRVRSHSIRGASEISITFAPRTDMTYALQLVRARVNQASGALPPDVSIEIEQLTPSLFPVLSYNLEGGDAATLYDLARYEIKPLISRVPGVGRVDVQGSDVREIEVIVDPARLVAQGMAYADVGRPPEAGLRPGRSGPGRRSLRARRDAPRRRARGGGAVAVPASRADHGDQRDGDSPDVGHHGVRDEPDWPDLQSDDSGRDGDRDRTRHRRRGGDHREHRASSRTPRRASAGHPRGSPGAHLAFF